jgi:hypothetical protein
MPNLYTTNPDVFGDELFQALFRDYPDGFPVGDPDNQKVGPGGIRKGPEDVMLSKTRPSARR